MASVETPLVSIIVWPFDVAAPSHEVPLVQLWQKERQAMHVPLTVK